jgi:hypothetical protein
VSSIIERWDMSSRMVSSVSPGPQEGGGWHGSDIFAVVDIYGARFYIAVDNQKRSEWFDSSALNGTCLHVIVRYSLHSRPGLATVSKYSMCLLNKSSSLNCLSIRVLSSPWRWHKHCHYGILLIMKKLYTRHSPAVVCKTWHPPHQQISSSVLWASDRLGDERNLSTMNRLPHIWPEHTSLHPWTNKHRRLLQQSSMFVGHRGSMTCVLFKSILLSSQRVLLFASVHCLPLTTNDVWATNKNTDYACFTRHDNVPKGDGVADGVLVSEALKEQVLEFHVAFILSRFRDVVNTLVSSFVWFSS